MFFVFDRCKFRRAPFWMNTKDGIPRSIEEEREFKKCHVFSVVTKKRTIEAVFKSKR